DVEGPIALVMAAMNERRPIPDHAPHLGQDVDRDRAVDEREARQNHGHDHPRPPDGAREAPPGDHAQHARPHPPRAGIAPIAEIVQRPAARLGHASFASRTHAFAPTARKKAASSVRFSAASLRTWTPLETAARRITAVSLP